MHSYSIFHASRGTYFCGVDRHAPGLERLLWKIREGFLIGDAYPQDITFQMGPRYCGLIIGDLLQNHLGYCMASAKLKRIFEREAGVDTEFLPFRLLNHKRRIAAEECYIVNLLGSIDCVDMSRSAGLISLANPGTFLALEKLVLDPSKIDPNRRAFRVRAKPYLIIVRDDLRAIIESEGITGAQFIPMGAPVNF